MFILLGILFSIGAAIAVVVIARDQANLKATIKKYDLENRAQVNSDSADKEFRDSLPNFLIYQTDRELEYARWISYLHFRLKTTKEDLDKETERVAWLSGRNQELVKEKELLEQSILNPRDVKRDISGAKGAAIGKSKRKSNKRKSSRRGNK